MSHEHLIFHGGLKGHVSNGTNVDHHLPCILGVRVGSSFTGYFYNLSKTAAIKLNLVRVVPLAQSTKQET